MSEKTIYIEDDIFSDFDSNLTPHPITGEIKIVKNEDSINQSIKSIITTNFYELFRDVFFGANILHDLFELFDQISAARYAQEIERAIQNYEPRTRFLQAIIKIEEDYNRVRITIVHQPRNLLKPITVDVFIERVR